ncbi:hypothetical protein IM511_01940 [Erythrobacteraceae bacterium E2-1 Yellow Sea]|nr:hypothetical protein [Erythrobacteraceae bacterium E2-1 Yellow Sea]
MPGIFALLAPVALLIPLSGSDLPSNDAANEDTSLLIETANEARPDETIREILLVPYDDPIQNQVRIERRVVVRISPREPAGRQNLMAELPRAPAPQRFEERKMEKCVPIHNIAGVQTGSGNQLMLYLRDHRVVSARLEKACLARDFYSGFYLEKNKDGKLCVDRDKLQSRAGANCELKRMRELVPVAP